MSSGAGRGRGWLNLSRSAEPPRPGGMAKPLVNNPENASPGPQNYEYQGLIDKIKELSVTDDGIMFNKKMQYIQSCWSQECNCKEDVERSFEDIYNACLNDTDLASKLLALIASRTFISQEIQEINLRHQFLKRLQKDIENSNQLQTISPLMFRNCVHMLGEFYSKARSSNGDPFKFLAVPFLSCLELLLTNKTLPDLIVFTTQLFLSYTTIKNSEPEELAKLLVKIRTVLVTESALGKEAKVWLLLALDLYSVRFGILQPEVYKFYEDQLGGAAMINFQRPHDALSIQTLHASKVLDSYQSNVNVLQISTSPTEPPSEQFSNAPEFASQNNFPKDVPPGKSKEKTGRPILGVGARFIKKPTEENGSWSKPRAHSNKKPPNLKSNKGWEHDDRFDNDYN